MLIAELQRDMIFKKKNSSKSCISDPVFGEMNYIENKWIGQVHFEPYQRKGISIAIQDKVYGENERNSFLSFKERYPGISEKIHEQLLAVIQECSLKNERDGHYCQSVPEVNSPDQLETMIFLYSIEFFNSGKTIRLLYEFGYHSEYVIAVSLKGEQVTNISFS